MKILMINSVCGIGSTGKICVQAAREFEAQGHTVKIAYGRDGFVPEEFKPYAVRIGNDLGVRLHGVYSRLTDRHGFGSKAATKKFLAWADAFDPDFLWLHNLHGYYLHIGLLFQWIKSRPQMQVEWTLHDCWSFTGHCAHFDYIGCEKWKTGCHNCPQKSSYPGSLFADCSRKNYAQKKALFTGIPNLTLITPSAWLAEKAKQSFLGEYPTQVRHNTIDLHTFQPTPGDFRQRYALDGKTIVLGVASAWNDRKGLSDFGKLRQLLSEEYAIVLVGLTPQQIQQIPAGILALPRTNTPGELAQIYTAADVFVNLTYEDTYPTVNLEAQACGTPVISYDTGGCRETLNEAGILIPKGDLPAAAKAISGLQRNK